VPRSALSGTLRSLGAFVVYNLIFGAVIPGIDNTAHIGGLITGLVVGALVAVGAPRQEHAPRRAAIFLVVILALAGVAIAAGHHYGLPLRLGRSPFALGKLAPPRKTVPHPFAVFAKAWIPRTHSLRNRRVSGL